MHNNKAPTLSVANIEYIGLMLPDFIQSLQLTLSMSLGMIFNYRFLLFSLRSSFCLKLEDYKNIQF